MTPSLPSGLARSLAWLLLFSGHRGRRQPSPHAASGPSVRQSPRAGPVAPRRCASVRRSSDDAHRCGCAPASSPVGFARICSVSEDRRLAARPISPSSRSPCPQSSPAQPGCSRGSSSSPGGHRRSLASSGAPTRLQRASGATPRPSGLCSPRAPPLGPDNLNSPSF